MIDNIHMVDYSAIKDKAKQMWSTFAPFENVTGLAAPELVKFAGVQKGDKVLDVGCGTGVVAITAAKQLRFERVQSRARSEDGDLSDLEARDKRETGWGLDVIIQEADFSFSNESDLDDLKTRVSAWLDNL